MKADNYKIMDFLRNEDVKITSEDALDCYKKHKDDQTALIFLDPPYQGTDNSNYSNPSFEIYEYLFENSIKNEKAKITLAVNYNYMMRLLFKDVIYHTYDKTYEVTRRKTKHMIIMN
jgi:site-specific DNA-adenine methylase